MIRERARGGTEIDRPGRRAPWVGFAKRAICMSFARHGISLMQRKRGGWREFPRLHNDDDGVHFRKQRNWERIWMVRRRGVHEYTALADDSGAVAIAMVIELAVRFVW